MSLAIVFSELTCINGDCSILGQWGGGKAGNPRTKQKREKRAIERKKEEKKRQGAAISVHENTALLSE